MKNLIFTSVFLLLTVPCLAEIIIVDNDWPYDFNNIQAAIDYSSDGDYIIVFPGTYTGTGNRDIDFLGKAVTVQSIVPTDPYIVAETIIDCNHLGRGFNFVSGEYANSVLAGFTITNGSGDTGGSIYCYNSSPTITNCTFSGNSASDKGGGMFSNHNSNPTLTGCTFTGNSAYFGGGMYNYESSSPTITNCTFTGNSASDGGGIHNYESSSPTITNCTFTGNSAFYYGGGMRNERFSSPTITNCTFSDNSAGSNGGGMFNYYSSSPTITNCTFTANSGRGMQNYESSSPTITNCTFTANIGGGMSNVSSSSPTITNCTFSDNSAELNGAGIYNFDSCNATITNCTFSDNSAFEGTGMYNGHFSYPTITNCTFSNNSATRGGGMLNNYSEPAVTNCTFTGNSASGSSYGHGGGGMYNASYSSPTLTNCTFSGNSAYRGGGIYNHYDSSLTVANCILWGNIATNGPQIYNYSVTPNVSFSDVQGGWTGTGNIDADPLFIDANGSDNIPGTEDDNLRLLPDSPCIDTANNIAIPIGIETDLDGRDRFADGDCNTTIIVDMGAFEFSYAYMGDFDSDCDVDFIDFAIQADFWLTDEFLVDIAPTPAGDGIVDTSDLAILCDNWLESF